MGDRGNIDEENPHFPNDKDESHENSIASSASVPVFPTETTPLIQNTDDDSSGQRTLHPSKSFSTTEGIHPYTRENRPKRRPFHLTPQRRISAEQDSHLYARFRYYSRLRAPAESSDHALVIPDHVVPGELFLFLLPGQHRDSDGKHESYITIASLWNTMMGSSLLTMPWAFGQAGFIGGVVIMVVQAGVCLYTACKLLTLQKTMGMQGEMHEVGYLVRYLWSGSLGKGIEGTAVAFSVVTLVGALIVYWVLMSNFLYNTGEAIYQFGWGTSDDAANNTGVVCPSNMTHATISSVIDPDDAFHRFWKQDLSVPIILLIPFIFLLNIKNTSVFTYFNSFGAISVMAIYFFVMVKASHWGFNFSLTDSSSPLYIPLFERNFMALSGTLSLAYFLHNCVITLLKGNKHPENNVRDISIAYFLVAITYIPVGMIFYLTFPLPKFCVAANFLDNFPPHNVALAIARAFLLFQMLTVYPLLSYFLRSQLLSYILGPGVPHTWRQIMAINAVLLFICASVAIFYPNIGFIIRWVGAISGLAYIFVIPAATDWQVHYLKGNLTWWRIILCVIIISLGVVNFAAQFFVS